MWEANGGEERGGFALKVAWICVHYEQPPAARNIDKVMKRTWI